MRLRIARDSSGYRIPGPAVFAGIMLVVLGLTAAATISTSEGPVICPFRAVTGLPCPSCGLLRSASAVLTGHPGDAFATNPLDTFFLLVCAPVAVALWLVRRLRGIVLRLEMSRGERFASWAALIAAVLINWGYVLATQL